MKNEKDQSDTNEKVNTVKNEEKRELAVNQGDNIESGSAKCRQRRNGVVSVTDNGKLGLPNLGFEYERSEEMEEDCLSDNAGLGRPEESVTGGLSRKFPLPLIDDESVKRPIDVPERSQSREDNRIGSVEDGNYLSTSEDKQGVLGLPTLSPIYPSKKRRPKSVKDWLRDPNLYKVCNIVVSLYFENR